MFSIRLNTVFSSLVIALLILFNCNSTLGDDAYGSVVVSGVNISVVENFVHEDSDPFKGWFNLTIENSGSIPWTGMHFSFFEVPGQGSIENASFLIDAPNEPVSSQVLSGIDVDNVSVPATLDLYFTSDPILPGETGTFSVYTENAGQLPFFGLAVYPSPEPASMALLMAGSVLIARRRK